SAAPFVYAIELYYGDGRGGFTQQNQPNVGTVDGKAILADLDHDGKLDLALGKSARISFGDGTGHFSTPIAIDNATLIAPGSIDANGSQGLFVTSGGSVQVVTVGTDRQPVMTPAFTVAQNTSAFVADVDGDGVAEVIIDDGTVKVMKKGAGGW